MKREVIRIYARYGAMPEMLVLELKALGDHAEERFPALVTEFGAKWRLWIERLPKLHPRKKAIITHPPRRQRSKLDAAEGVVRAGDARFSFTSTQPAHP